MPGEPTPTWGGTGMPVEIQLSLNFQETVILTKSDFQSSYPGSPTQPAPSVDTTPRQNGIGQGNNPAGGQSFSSTPGGAAVRSFTNRGG